MLVEYKTLTQITFCIKIHKSGLPHSQEKVRKMTKVRKSQVKMFFF